MKGKIKFFNKHKGFGFVIGEDEKEYFFHYTFLTNVGEGESLEEGTKIVFEPLDTQKGLQAKNVMLEEEPV